MSIFEPIPREWDEATRQIDVPPSDDNPAIHGTSLDPRSIKIAGGVLMAIVIAGLVASNLAEPEARPRPLVASRVDPGAAAVEQAEAKKSVPTSGPSASPSAEPVNEADGDAELDSGTDEASSWRTSDDSKWDNKPGKGRGRGRG